MKKVIVRLRDCHPTYIKTLRKRYYYSQSHYSYEVFDDFKDLQPGQEIWIKFGNQYEKFITYEDVLENSQLDNETFDDELYHMLVSEYDVDYFLKQYLSCY